MLRFDPAGGFVAGAALLLMAGTAQAQFPVTIVAGPTFSTVSSDAFDASTRTGFFAAVGTAFQLDERFAIAPYVGYVQKGAKFTGGDGEDIYTYIEIPVLLTTAFPVSGTTSLGLALGPQVSFNIKCNETVPGEPDYDCTDYEDYGGGTEFGIMGSVGLQFPRGTSTLGVGGGFDFALKDTFDDIPGGYKNRGFFLFVSYGLVLGGM